MSTPSNKASNCLNRPYHKNHLPYREHLGTEHLVDPWDLNPKPDFDPYTLNLSLVHGSCVSRQ